MTSSHARSRQLLAGLCLCGRPLSVHRDRRNLSISCAELAEAEQGRQAALSCTTADSAKRAQARQLDRAVERMVSL